MLDLRGRVIALPRPSPTAEKPIPEGT
jgi:hypothetical protein